MLVTWPNLAPGVACRGPGTDRVDVQELRLIEGVDEVRPELETRRATETHVLRHGEVPLVTAGQTERRDRRVAVLTCRRGYERRGVEPEQAGLVARRRVAHLIGPQRSWKHESVVLQLATCTRAAGPDSILVIPAICHPPTGPSASPLSLRGRMAARRRKTR